MEVLSGGFWGLVCSSFWFDPQNTNVFCRQLGYDGALAVSSYEEHNSGTCLNVGCIGNESSILRCRSNGWEFGSLVTSVLCTPAGISFAFSRSLTCTSPLSTPRPEVCLASCVIWIIQLAAYSREVISSQTKHL